MTVAISSYGHNGRMAIDIVGWATAAGTLGSIPNPEGAPLLIVRAVLYSKVISAAATILHIGIGATATTDATDVLDTVDLNALAAGTSINCFAVIVANHTANSAVPIVWTAATFLNFTTSVAASTAFRGTLFLDYIRLTD